MKKILKRDLRSILSVKFGVPAVLNVTKKNLQKVPVVGQKFNSWTDNFFQFCR